MKTKKIDIFVEYKTRFIKALCTYNPDLVVDWVKYEGGYVHSKTITYTGSGITQERLSKFIERTERVEKRVADGYRVDGHIIEIVLKIKIKHYIKGIEALGYAVRLFDDCIHIDKELSKTISKTLSKLIKHKDTNESLEEQKKYLGIVLKNIKMSFSFDNLFESENDQKGM